MSISAHSLSLKRNNRLLLKDVSFSALSGEITAIVGPNGAGKTTLMKAAAGAFLELKDSVSMNDEHLSELSLTDLAQVRAVMSTNVELGFNYAVRDVLEMGWVQLRRYSDAQMRGALHSCSETADITHILDQSFNTLSSGEQQRVQFARALLQIWRTPQERTQARYLLLDEPTSNLDLAHEIELLDELRRLRAHNVSSLIILHDLNLAARFADRVLLMMSGKIVCSGAVDQVFQAERLSEVYQCAVTVEWHSGLQRWLVFS
ncbi:MAG: ATP-binding cassette domain-containing protein [Pseudomonadota bacterium]